MKDTKENNLTRRNFLISLGTTALSISGYFLIGGGSLKEVLADTEGVVAGMRPKLVPDIFFEESTSDLTLLQRRDANHHNKCAVNRIGSFIIRRLNGRHTIEGISSLLSEEEGFTRYHSLEADIAQFVANLGMLGFLLDPFYANIIEVVES